MDLIKTRKDKSQVHLLCNDHVPNFAMKNEFQTSSFSLRMNHLEIHEEEFYGYTIEEGGMFLCVSLTIRNLTNEILSFSKNDFFIMYDKEGPYEPEENFNVKHQFEDEMALKPYEEIHGKYVFIISSSTKKITFKYFEAYDDQRVKEYRLRYVIPQ